MKVNTDSSFKLPDLVGGVGVVIRDCSGNLVDDCNDLLLISSAFGAEATALVVGMKYAQMKGYSHVMIKIDCKDLYEALQDDTRYLWPAKPIVEELPVIKSSFRSGTGR